MGYTKEDNESANYLISQWEEKNNEIITIEWIGDVSQCNQGVFDELTQRGWTINLWSKK